MGLIDRVRGLFEKRDLALDNPKAWNISLWNFGGQQSDAGVQVDEYNALGHGAVYACIKLLADTVASLPLFLYERMPGGGKKKVNIPIYNLLTNPNPEMTFFRFMQTLQGHIGSWGNSYIYNQRANGRIRYVWPLRPDLMEVKRDPDTGQMAYIFNHPSRPIPLTSEDVCHVPGWGFDGITGYSPIGMARQAIGLGMAAEEFGARFFGTGTHVSMTFEHPGKLSPDGYASLKKELSDKYATLGKSHQIMLLQEGMKATPVTIPPNDAQFLETRAFQVPEICRFYRVPPHMVAHLDNATFSNIEHQAIDFVVHTIRPWLCLWESELSRYYLAPSQRKKYFFEFLIDGLLRGDIEARYKAYATARTNGWMNADEIRELENMNPIPDGSGETYLVPLNLINAKDAANPPAPAPAAPPEPEDARGFFLEHRAGIPADTRADSNAIAMRQRIRESYLRLFRNAAKQVVTRETESLKKAIKKHLGQRSMDGFYTWMDKFYRADFPTYITKKMMPVFTSYAEEMHAAAADEVGVEPGMDSSGLEVVTEYNSSYVNRHINSSKGQIQALEADTDPEELPEVLTERADEWQERRPDKIAENESARMGNAVAMFVFMAAGIVRMMWQTVGESCPYCQMLHGRTVATGSAFISGEELSPEGMEPMMVYGVHKHPPLHQGCDCMIVPRI